MNTMYTSVLERQNEIGIMKSIGSTNGTIFTLFFIESGLLGVFGGFIGIIIGISFAELSAFIGRLILQSSLIQAEFSLNLILGAVLFSFIVGSLAGTIPAITASRLQPVDALRK